MRDANQNLRLTIGQVGAEKTNAQLGSLNASITSMAKNIGLAVLSVAALRKAFGVLSESVSLAKVQEIAIKQVDQALLNAGVTAEGASDKFQQMASSLQAVSNFGDEEILGNVTTELLKFGSVTMDIMPKAQQLVVDMAAKTGNLADQAKTLGISLEKPELGLTRLRRQGVTFTEEQENMVKALVATGKHAEAQAIILEGLETKYKGMALASVDSAKQLKNTWGDLQEVIGTQLRPALDGINYAFISMMNAWISSLSDVTNKTAEEAANMSRIWARVTIEATAGIKLLFSTVSNIGMLISTSILGFFHVNMVAIDKTLAVVLNSFRVVKEAATFNFSGAGEAMADIGKNMTDMSKAFDDYAKGMGNRAGKIYSDIASMESNTAKQVTEAWAAIDARLAAQLSARRGASADTGDGGAGETPAPDNSKALDAMKAYFDAVMKLNQSEAEAIKTKYAAMRAEGLKYFSETSDSYAAMNAEITKAEAAEILDRLSAISHGKQSEFAIIEANHKKQLAALDDYHTTGLLAERDYSDAVAAIEKQRTDASLAYYAEIASHAATQRETLVDTTLSMLSDIKGAYGAYYAYRSEQITAMAAKYEQMGVEQVFIESWVTSQMSQIWEEYHEAHKAELDKMQEASNEILGRMGASIEGNLTNALGSLISSTKSAADAWGDMWKSMVRILSNAVAQMIVKLTLLAFWQAITGTGGITKAATMGSVPAGGFDLPAFGGGGFASVGSSLGSAPGFASTQPPPINVNLAANTQLMARMERLIDAVENNQPQIYTQVIEGIPLHKAVQRAETVANVL